jgi:hypothetical protein
VLAKLRCPIAAAAIDDDGFGVGREAAQVSNKSDHRLGFVQSRDDDGNAHGLKIRTKRNHEMNSQKSLIKKTALLAALLVGFSAAIANAGVPSGIKNDSYDRLLKKYVNEQGLVAYGKWKSNAGDVNALDDYLAQFAKSGDAKGNERCASLINAYNAFVLQWILKSYPTESIWELKGSFKTARHQLGGETVSLDDIENKMLRPEFGWRTHAALVCAARSCPPLGQSAYSGDKLENQDAEAFRRWLGRSDLNEFLPAKNEANVSSIFKWFKDDFEKAGGAKAILEKYASESAQAMLKKSDVKISYKPYNWGLNDQGSHGRNYKMSLFNYLH